MKATVLTGIDRLFQENLYDFRGKGVGLLVHPASVAKNLTSTLDLFLAQKVRLTRLFGPEHGIRGAAQDMISVGAETDAKTGLPVTSLYGNSFASLKPTTDDLVDVDVLVCDLQDIGSRYYTYITTIAFCMKACAELGKEVLILDRPNPVNGIAIEGKILKKGFESFVGYYPFPIRHGMTMGEMARWINQEEGLNCKLTIIPMKGWQRRFHFDDTSLPWVLPSPNMPTLDTALVYPGLCLIEATEVSEGRGTTRPFELVGAPYVNGEEWAKHLATLKLPGVLFRPTLFHPTFQKWGGKDCGGLQLHVTDRNQFKPVITGVALLKTLHDLYPAQFKWREKPYEFVTNIPAIDLLSGDDKLRTDIEADRSIEEIMSDWKNGYDDFMKKRQNYLLYK